MNGYVTAGVSNTITLGLSAGAAIDTTEATAEFCYWADYIYSVFLSADVSYISLCLSPNRTQLICDN